MASKHLLAGPWVGEFGWELFAWQAYIRSLSRHYDKTTIICRPTSHSIYTDFADNFMYYSPDKGQADSFMHGLNFLKQLEIYCLVLICLTRTPLCLYQEEFGVPPHTLV